LGVEISESGDWKGTLERRRFVRFFTYGAAIVGTFLLGRFSSVAEAERGGVSETRRSTTTKTSTAVTTMGPIMTFPYMAWAVQLRSGTYWKWGKWFDILPEGTVKNDFSVVGIHLRTNDYDGAIELGSGSEGSEMVLAHLPSSACASAYGLTSIVFLPSPIRLKAGSRVAARYSVGAETSRWVQVKILYQEILPA